MQGIDYVKSVQLLQEALGEKLSGLIIGQNGKSSTLNGWLPSAILGTKVVDAVGDIRAHPTGDMGSIGMAGSPEQMIQTAVGGNRSENRYIELVVKGATAKISPVLRAAADQSGGFIASCRNPLRASYVRSHAALGGISMALALGEAIIAAEKRGGSAVIDAICKTTGGHILAEGIITRKDVVYTKEAFDIGTITVGSGGTSVTLHVMNEYMAVDDADGGRLATFPPSSPRFHRRVSRSASASSRRACMSSSCMCRWISFRCRQACSIRPSIPSSKRRWGSRSHAMHWRRRPEPWRAIPVSKN